MAENIDLYDRKHSRSHIWPPHILQEVHAKAELGRYQIRGFSTFHNIPTLSQLVFLPAAMTRLPLEGYRESCNTKTILGGYKKDLVSNPIELDIPIYIAGMSFGSLSKNAKMALGRGATMVGSATTTGEGGMLREERAASKTLIYQMTPSRYSLTLGHLRNSEAIEIAVGQGAKPGTGGVLLGMKVIDKVVEMRQLPSGIDQRSSVRHPDFLGADDMQIKIEELRDATGYKVPIFIKMPACRVTQDVKIAAKSGVDVIVLDGMEGSTGASPEFQLDHTGIPTLAAIPAARRALEDIGMYGKVSLVVSGGIKSGADMAKAIALGADAVAIGTASLVALGCNMPQYHEDYAALGTIPGACHHCHTGRCPMGITTQDEILQERLDPDEGAERLANYLRAVTMELTMIAKSCGKSDVHDLEPEDMRALTLDASAMTGVPLVGVDKVVAPWGSE
ncbi:MAG: FMN-binding glutamate synthase family protein [Chloroflexi bacterium]|nr:FMN-binding glutamate synthase family protein [Chloroflexota bacterium]